MKSQKSKVKSQKLRRWEEKKSQLLSFSTSQVLIFFFLLLTSHFSLPAFCSAAKWSGVDESVVEKVAKEHGREVHEPLINTDQGDLLLFVFLIAGAVAGFAAGYYWRTLTEHKSGYTKKY